MTDDQIVEIAGEKVLITREGESWYWRGADWTGHRASSGPFLTREDAVEHARRYFTRDPGAG
jgi:hypothetical protein